MRNVRRKLWSREQTILGTLEDNISKEVAKAQLDALNSGTGYIQIDAEGKIRHVTLKEIMKEVKNK